MQRALERRSSPPPLREQLRRCHPGHSLARSCRGGKQRLWGRAPRLVAPSLVATQNTRRASQESSPHLPNTCSRRLRRLPAVSLPGSRALLVSVEYGREAPERPGRSWAQLAGALARAPSPSKSPRTTFSASSEKLPKRPRRSHPKAASANQAFVSHNWRPLHQMRVDDHSRSERPRREWHRRSGLALFGVTAFSSARENPFSEKQ